jgi:hypothetical protein
MKEAVHASKTFSGSTARVTYPSAIVSRVTEDGGKVNCTVFPETDAVDRFVVTASGCSNVLCW